MKSVVIGATAGVGRALSDGLAKLGHSLLLVGRDVRDLDACARSLRLCYGVEIQILAADALDPTFFASSLKEAAIIFEEVNYLFLPIGASITQDNGELEPKEIDSLINSNLVSIINAVQIFLPFLSENGSSRIVGFGSIAAIRGKGSNVVYSAAKRGLEGYFESLRYLLINSNISIHLYKLGYVNTQQSYGQTLSLPKISPDKVARYVIGNLRRSSCVNYYPRYWRFMALLLRSLPLSIFKKIVK